MAPAKRRAASNAFTTCRSPLPMSGRWRQQAGTTRLSRPAVRPLHCIVDQARSLSVRRTGCDQKQRKAWVAGRARQKPIRRRAFGSILHTPCAGRDRADAPFLHRLRRPSSETHQVRATRLCKSQVEAILTRAAAVTGCHKWVQARGFGRGVLQWDRPRWRSCSQCVHDPARPGFGPKGASSRSEEEEDPRHGEDGERQSNWSGSAAPERRRNATARPAKGRRRRHQRVEQLRTGPTHEGRCAARTSSHGQERSCAGSLPETRPVAANVSTCGGCEHARQKAEHIRRRR